ncbi:hypothetical protein ACP275_04G146000 [Erythranthe tilingii]
MAKKKKYKRAKSPAAAAQKKLEAGKKLPKDEGSHRRRVDEEERGDVQDLHLQGASFLYFQCSLVMFVKSSNRLLKESFGSEKKKKKNSLSPDLVTASMQGSHCLISYFFSLCTCLLIALVLKIGKNYCYFGFLKVYLVRGKKSTVGVLFFLGERINFFGIKCLIFCVLCLSIGFPIST